jgi:hypothetical protein
LDQAGILQQADHLGPDDVVEEILADGAVIAHWATEASPSVGTEASVVVDVAGT